jgi:hypothetical protein
MSGTVYETEPPCCRLGTIGILPLCGYCGVLGACRRLLSFSGDDQHTGLVIDIGAGGVQGGKADPVMVTAQQQIRWMRVPAARRDDHRNHGPGRAAAGAVGEEEPVVPLKFGYRA